VNQPARIDDQAGGGRAWVAAAEAARLLGVKRATLYAYASRGLVRNAPAAGGRGREYLREDVERLRARSRARSGHGAAAAGALRWGEPVLETRVGSIGEAGPLYRGQSALALARGGARFEDVCALLWGAPCEPAAVGQGFGAPVARLRGVLREGAGPFDGLLLAAGALAANEPHAEPSAEIARARAPLLVRRLVAACGLAAGGRAVADSLAAGGVARALLAALGGAAAPARVAALEEALVLSADHELNASTFAARVAASAGAGLPACAMAALGALSGPRHGGATARVEALVAEIGAPERAPAVVGDRLARGESVAGFGHPLYPQGDPRGARLLEVAQRVGARSRGVRVAVAAVDAMGLVARERPTLDVGLVALAAALGLPRGAPLAIFACARAAGWVAHALEQREAGYLLRPRARYVGD
jgi:citrate synthase